MTWINQSLGSDFFYYILNIGVYKIKGSDFIPFNIIRKDITLMNVDVIVNAANRELKMGSGVCGAIFRKAGASNMQVACDILSPISTSEAVITPGFNLDCSHVIHVAGPVYKDGKSNEKTELYNSYINSLKLAEKYKCKSIAFPLISSGVYGYPKAEALEVAVDAILDFLEESSMEVYLNLIK